MFAATAVVVTGVLVAFVGEDPTPEIATVRGPQVVEHPTPRLEAGRALDLEPLVVTPDAGYVRPPLLPSGDTVAVAAYDRTETGFTVPPSRIVRVATSDGGVRDRVDLEGEIVALADGEGARWALTRDQVVKGPADPRFRVKRIAGDGTVASHPVPPGEEPSGTIAAGGGGVWLPVRDGVLRFDLMTGAFASEDPARPRGATRDRRRREGRVRERWRRGAEARPDDRRCDRGGSSPVGDERSRAGVELSRAGRRAPRPGCHG